MSVIHACHSCLPFMFAIHTCHSCLPFKLASHTCHWTMQHFTCLTCVVETFVFCCFAIFLRLFVWRFSKFQWFVCVVFILIMLVSTVFSCCWMIYHFFLSCHVLFVLNSKIGNPPTPRHLPRAVTNCHLPLATSLGPTPPHSRAPPRRASRFNHQTHPHWGLKSTLNLPHFQCNLIRVLVSTLSNYFSRAFQ